MPTIKTAISVPSHLFDEMDSLSKHLRVPRSRLFAQADEEFLDRRRSEDLAARLNRAYEQGEPAREAKVRRASAGAFRRLVEGSW